MNYQKKHKLHKRIIGKYYSILNDLYVKVESSLLYKEILLNKEKKNIYLFSNPIHSNLGDQAQTVAITKWFADFYPDFHVIFLPQRLTTKETLDLIEEKSNAEDLFFVHSGYLIFDPHGELPFICTVVDKFKNKKITILPQTVNLKDAAIIDMVKAAFNNHKNLTLMCRDEVSFENSKKLFPSCRLLLWPDFVTYLIGDKKYHSKRNGILFCLRNDGEKYYTDEELNSLMKKFNNIKTVKYDTTIKKSYYAWKFNRNELIEKVLHKFSKYQLVITDRYHGTIFSQIASTPVIVLSSTDHKLSSGVKWFPNKNFGNNVFFAQDLNVAYKIANQILLRDGKIFENPSYFKDEYFTKSGVVSQETN